MEYTVDFDVRNFPFWSGAKDRVSELTYEQLDELGAYIEDCFDGTTPTETDINDFVWFDCDDFLAQLKGENEEEEEEEEEDY